MVIDVDNVLSIKLELLPPVSSSASSVQCGASSVTVDVQGLIVLLALDGQSLLVEPPYLLFVAVWLLNSNLSS